MAGPRKHGDRPASQRLLDDLARPGERPVLDALHHAQNGRLRRKLFGQRLERGAQVRRRHGRHHQIGSSRGLRRTRRHQDPIGQNHPRQVALVDPRAQQFFGMRTITRPEANIADSPLEQERKGRAHATSTQDRHPIHQRATNTTTALARYKLRSCTCDSFQANSRSRPLYALLRPGA